MKAIRSMLATLMAGFLSIHANAQQLIPLTDEAISRLGLVFMPVMAADSQAGTRFPATVIASPQTASELHALHGGVIESWQVQPGQQVEAGQVLAVLRSPEVLELQQQWMTAQTAEKQATLALSRDERLFAEGIIAGQRLQETERQTQEARFALQARLALLEQAGFGTEDLEALQTGQQTLGRYVLKAPLAGTVAHLDHPSGEMLVAGEELLALTGGALWIEARLPAALAARLTPEQTLHLADGSATLRVRQKDHALDSGTQTVGVLAEFTEAVELLPGQILTLLLPPENEGLMIPADAVVHNGAETLVFVRSSGGVESRALSLQPMGADYLASGGLVSGEEVVVRGAAILKGILLGLGGE